MNLSVKNVSDLLNISEKTIYRMIKNDSMPCYRVGGQWRFSKREIESWLEDKREFSNNPALTDFTLVDNDAISIAEFIKRGGIHYNISGNHKEEIILNCLEKCKTSIPQINVNQLYSAIMSREQICSTAMGNGIALPHPRPFKEFTASLSSISLCHLLKPISFDALDNDEVDTLFFIFPKNESRYLKIQTKLLRLLKENEILNALHELNSENFYKILSSKELELFGNNI